MASVVAKHPGCGGNALPATQAADDRRFKCLRCGVLFTLPGEASRLVALDEIAELVGGAGDVDPASIDCGFVGRETAFNTWTQEHDRIVRTSRDAVLFKIGDEEKWVPKSVLLEVDRDRFICALWWARENFEDL